MITFEGLDENFRFIVLDVLAQLKSTYGFIQEPTRELYAKIVAKDDYIDNLKTIIENKCYSTIHQDKTLDKQSINRIRSIQISCVNLERIADFCVNIVRQMGYLSTPEFLYSYDYTPIFEIIQESMSDILEVYNTGNLAGALKICKAEYKIDNLYKDLFNQVMDELETRHGAKNRITAIFIFRYLERIGDSLQNIGEALIFSILGEKIKIEQFESLQQTLSKSGFSGKFSDIDFQAIWGSRSGCRIGRVEHRDPDDEDTTDYQGGIYKEGSVDKIRREKENIHKWNEIFPGLVPGIFGYNEEDDRAAMLIEFLPGCTLDEIVLNSDDDLMQNAFFIFEQTVKDVWETTMKPGPADTDFMRQLKDRLAGVLSTHPTFRRTSLRVGEQHVLSTYELIARCSDIESGLKAPFSVFLHGDANINNVVYNHNNERVQYIDLYRSRDMDYVQDASVFLVSNFRMPIFDLELRTKINWVIEHYHSFIKNFAQIHGDKLFDARLALALARSFYTSTRFELNHEFAKEMYLRAHFLMDSVAEYKGEWEDFKLPEKILYY